MSKEFYSRFKDWKEKLKKDYVKILWGARDLVKPFYLPF